MHASLNIKSYVNDGFSKICDVINDGDGGWRYTDIDHDLMFSNHSSWIYFIVDGVEIVKIGETGNPLGIKGKHDPHHPISGTRGRLGRYMKQPDNTDGRIRKELYERVEKNKVSIWSRKCTTIDIPCKIGNTLGLTTLSCHKSMETAYLDHIFKRTGNYPRLNHGRM